MSIGQLLAVSQPYSYSGPLVLRNKSDNRVVLDSVTLAHADPEIVLLGAFILSIPIKPNGTRIGNALGYHIPSDGRRLQKALVAPHAQVQVVVGMKVTKPGRYSFDGITLRYHGRESNYRATYSYSGRLCAPAVKYEHRCPGLL